MSLRRPRKHNARGQKRKQHTCTKCGEPKFLHSNSACKEIQQQRNAQTGLSQGIDNAVPYLGCQTASFNIPYPQEAYQEGEQYGNSRHGEVGAVPPKTVDSREIQHQNIPSLEYGSAQNLPMPPTNETIVSTSTSEFPLNPGANIEFGLVPSLKSNQDNIDATYFRWLSELGFREIIGNEDNPTGNRRDAEGPIPVGTLGENRGRGRKQHEQRC